MLRTMNENVATANNMFVVDESALKALVTSGKFYDLSDRETLYSVSNRRQIVAAMFAAQNKGNLTFRENARLQRISKGYAVEAVMKAAELILSETAQVAVPTDVGSAETVVDEVAELKAAMRLMAEQVQALQKDAKIKNNNYEQLVKAVVLENRTGIKNKVYQEVVSKVGI